MNSSPASEAPQPSDTPRDQFGPLQLQLLERRALRDSSTPSAARALAVGTPDDPLGWWVYALADRAAPAHEALDRLISHQRTHVLGPDGTPLFGGEPPGQAALPPWLAQPWFGSVVASLGTAGFAVALFSGAALLLPWIGIGFVAVYAALVGADHICAHRYLPGWLKQQDARAEQIYRRYWSLLVRLAYVRAVAHHPDQSRRPAPFDAPDKELAQNIASCDAAIRRLHEWELFDVAPLTRFTAWSHTLCLRNILLPLRLRSISRHVRRYSDSVSSAEQQLMGCEQQLHAIEHLHVDLAMALGALRVRLEGLRALAGEVEAHTPEECEPILQELALLQQKLDLADQCSAAYGQDPERWPMLASSHRALPHFERRLGTVGARLKQLAAMRGRYEEALASGRAELAELRAVISFEQHQIPHVYLDDTVAAARQAGGVLSKWEGLPGHTDTYAKIEAAVGRLREGIKHRAKALAERREALERVLRFRAQLRELGMLLEQLRQETPEGIDGATGPHAAAASCLGTCLRELCAEQTEAWRASCTAEALDSAVGAPVREARREVQRINELRAQRASCWSTLYAEVEQLRRACAAAGDAPPVSVAEFLRLAAEAEAEIGTQQSSAGHPQAYERHITACRQLRAALAESRGHLDLKRERRAAVAAREGQLAACAAARRAAQTRGTVDGWQQIDALLAAAGARLATMVQRLTTDEAAAWETDCADQELSRDVDAPLVEANRRVAEIQQARKRFDEQLAAADQAIGSLRAALGRRPDGGDVSIEEFKATSDLAAGDVGSYRQRGRGLDQYHAFQPRLEQIVVEMAGLTRRLALKRQRLQQVFELHARLRRLRAQVSHEQANTPVGLLMAVGDLDPTHGQIKEGWRLLVTPTGSRWHDELTEQWLQQIAAALQDAEQRLQKVVEDGAATRVLWGEVHNHLNAFKTSLRLDHSDPNRRVNLNEFWRFVANREAAMAGLADELNKRASPQGYQRILASLQAIRDVIKGQEKHLAEKQHCAALVRSYEQEVEDVAGSIRAEKPLIPELQKLLDILGTARSLLGVYAQALFSPSPSDWSATVNRDLLRDEISLRLTRCRDGLKQIQDLRAQLRGAIAQTQHALERLSLSLAQLPPVPIFKDDGRAAHGKWQKELVDVRNGMHRPDATTALYATWIEHLSEGVGTLLTIDQRLNARADLVQRIYAESSQLTQRVNDLKTTLINDGPSKRIKFTALPGRLSLLLKEIAVTEKRAGVQDDQQELEKLLETIQGAHARAYDELVREQRRALDDREQIRGYEGFANNIEWLVKVLKTFQNLSHSEQLIHNLQFTVENLRTLIPSNADGTPGAIDDGVLAQSLSSLKALESGLVKQLEEVLKVARERCRLWRPVTSSWACLTTLQQRMEREIGSLQPVVRQSMDLDRLHKFVLNLVGVYRTDEELAKTQRDINKALQEIDALRDLLEERVTASTQKKTIAQVDSWLSEAAQQPQTKDALETLKQGQKYLKNIMKGEGLTQIINQYGEKATAVAANSFDRSIAGDSAEMNITMPEPAEEPAPAPATPTQRPQRRAP